MQKEIKSREEWDESNGYKVFHEPVCATCQHFIFKPGMDHDIQGICKYMVDKGLRNSGVTVTACCKRYVRNRNNR